MTTEQLSSIEERIQKPGYLLLVVTVLIFLIIGLIDLIDHNDAEGAILGRYSTPYFGFMLIYAGVTLLWASLLLRPNNDRWLRRSLGFIQSHALVTIGLLLIMGAIAAEMIQWGLETDHGILYLPGLQATIFTLFVLAVGLILFYNWRDAKLWRKILVAVLLLVLSIEMVIQVLAYFGLAPSLTDTMDSYGPYTRIYQSEEGFGNGLTNNYGWYAPEFELEPGSYRVAITGDSFVQGLQVAKEENLGAVLNRLLDEGKVVDQPVEVLSLGHPNLGPGIYLSNWLLDVAKRAYDPQEVIVFFDLGSDFQTVDRPATGVPYFIYEGQGTAQIDLDNFYGDLHTKEHEVYRGYEGTQPIRVIYSNLLSVRYVHNLLQRPRRYPAEAGPVPQNEDIALTNGFVFNDEMGEEARLIAASILNGSNEQLKRAGIKMSLVTIPVFTDAFYEQAAWNTQFGASDLLLPEERLRQSARSYGIPFLGLGTLMASKEMSPAAVQELYFEDGRGHFTPQGHAFAAQAVFDCFFVETIGPEQGCDRN